MSILGICPEVLTSLRPHELWCRNSKNSRSCCLSHPLLTYKWTARNSYFAWSLIRGTNLHRYPEWARYQCDPTVLLPGIKDVHAPRRVLVFFSDMIEVYLGISPSLWNLDCDFTLAVKSPQCSQKFDCSEVNGAIVSLRVSMWHPPWLECSKLRIRAYASASGNEREAKPRNQKDSCLRTRVCIIQRSDTHFSQMPYWCKVVVLLTDLTSIRLRLR